MVELEREAPPRKRLKIVEPAVVSLIVWLLYRLMSPQICTGLGAARDATTAHRISQLDQATESFQIDFGFYPPGDGSGSQRLVADLTRTGPRRMKYFEFPPDLLNGGDVIDPSCEWGVIHYRFPGIHRPGKFDLWARDSKDNPEGINNW